MYLINGEFFEDTLAKIPADDRGVLYGDQVVEVFVAFRGQVMEVAAHLERLRESAAVLGFEIYQGDSELSFELETLAERMACQKSLLRLTVSRGRGYGLHLGSDLQPQRYIYGSAVGNSYRDLCLGLVQDQRKPGPQAKLAYRLPEILAIRKLEEKFDDILWFNQARDLTETSTANIFFVRRRGDVVEVVTPALTSGILAGVTRARVISLLQRAGIPVFEEEVNVDTLAAFDEAFTSSTVQGLLPVRQIFTKKFYTLRKNGVYQHILRLFHAWAHSVLGYKVDWFSGEKI